MIKKVPKEHIKKLSACQNLKNLTRPFQEFQKELSVTRRYWGLFTDRIPSK